MRIKTNVEVSPYFGGGFKSYGPYQWDIKYYGWECDSEIESAQQWAFGEHCQLKDGTRGFDYLNDLMGREIEAYIEGHSGGWLVVHTELSQAELEKLDKHVKACMDGLDEYLKDERQAQADIDAEIERETLEREAKLNSDIRVKRIKELIKDIAGQDATLTISGIKII